MKIQKTVTKRADLPKLVSRLKRQGRKIVFTNGVVDILHRGHVEYLAKARKLGDILIFGLNSDASTRRLKGKDRPIQKQADRAIILLHLEAVDYVVIFGEDTPEKLIRQVCPDLLVKGADYKVTEIVGSEFVKSYGGKVKTISLTKGRSTSRIVGKLGAAKKLNRPNS